MFTGKSIIILLLLCSFSNGAFAEYNPFLGSWEVQTIGVPQILIFEFINDTEMIVHSGQDTNTMNYFFDNYEQIITLYFDQNQVMTFEYEFTGDIFDLYIQDWESSPFANQMVSSFDKMRGINNITDNFVDEMVDFMKNIFYEIPLMRGTLLNK